MKIITLFIFYNIILLTINQREIKNFSFASYSYSYNLTKKKNNTFILNEKNTTKYIKANKVDYNRTILNENFSIYVDIDNLFSLYENNIDFSNHSNIIKCLAFYSPEFFYKEKWIHINNAKSLFKGHNQPRKPYIENKELIYGNYSDLDIIVNDIKLAKSHGIYGFAIYYYWSYDKILFGKPLELYFENKNIIDFPFILVWKNNNDSNIININSNDYSYKFFEDIKKYIIDTRYIKINEKPVIAIYDNYNNDNLKYIIKNLREKCIQKQIGEIYIIINLENYNLEEIKNKQIFDAAYEFYPNKRLNNFTSIHSLIRIYSSIIYFNLHDLVSEPYVFKNISNDFPFFRCSMLEFDNSTKNENNSIIYHLYSPEQFYNFNKYLIQWTNNHYNESNKFIFINSWNIFDEGSYLEPDRKYGYASLNALSKALFNLTYKQNNNISNLIISTIIAVQVHIYYEDLIQKLISKINNIPMKYDLYISTNSLENSNHIKNYLTNNSNANKYEIMIYENKGRDILPFLEQMKNVYKNYKYICHIHSKKTKQLPITGQLWRDYLYNNLIGNKEVIIRIISEFESNDKIGFIFPENFFFTFSDENNSREPLNKIQINYLLNIIFPNNKYKVGDLLDFPAGNMFWARVSSIHQIFGINIYDKVPSEEGQFDCTILHGVERIWLYLVKINGYYYHKIFNQY